jgi:hypothetical protein
MQTVVTADASIKRGRREEMTQATAGDDLRPQQSQAKRPAAAGGLSFSEMVAYNELLASQSQSSEAAASTGESVVIKPAGEALDDDDLWEVVDESVLLRDFMTPTSTGFHQPGEDSSPVVSRTAGTAQSPIQLSSSSPSQGSADTQAATAAGQGNVGSRQRGRRFEQHQVDALKAAYERDPLPSAASRRALADQIGDTITRVTTWYIPSFTRRACVLRHSAR